MKYEHVKPKANHRKILTILEKEFYHKCLPEASIRFRLRSYIYHLINLNETILQQSFYHVKYPSEYYKLTVLKLHTEITILFCFLFCIKDAMPWDY